MANARSFEEESESFNYVQAELGDAEMELREILDERPIPPGALHASMMRMERAIQDFKSGSSQFLGALQEHPTEQQRQLMMDKTNLERVQKLLDEADVVKARTPQYEPPRKLPDRQDENSTPESPLQRVLSLLGDEERDGAGNERGGQIELNAGDEDVTRRTDTGAQDRDSDEASVSNQGGPMPRTGNANDAITTALNAITRKLDLYDGKLNSIENLCMRQRIETEVVSKTLTRHIKTSKEVNSGFEQRVTMMEASVQEMRETMTRMQKATPPHVIQPLRPTVTFDADEGAEESKEDMRLREEPRARRLRASLHNERQRPMEHPHFNVSPIDTQAEGRRLPTAESTRLSFPPMRDRMDNSEQSMMESYMDRSAAVMEQMSALMTLNTETRRMNKLSRKLPKRELMTFDGDPTQYRRFRNAFDDAVEEKDADAGTKLGILLHYCSDNVKTALASCESQPNKEEAYRQALEILEERYGNPYLVSQSWTNRLLTLSSPRTAPELEKFAAELTTCHATLKTLGTTSRMQDGLYMHMVLSKLPVYLQIRWRTQFHDKLETTKKGTDFGDMVELVKRASRECTYPMYSPDSFAMVKPLALQFVQTYNAVKRSSGSRLTGTRQTAMLATETTENDVDEIDGDLSAMDQMEDESVQGPQELMGEETCYHQGLSSAKTDAKRKTQRPRVKNACPCCDAKHYLARCPVFLEMSNAKRLKFVRQQGLCLSCFARGHKVVDCGSKYTCSENDCGAKHNTSLHHAMVTPIPNVGQSTVVDTQTVGFATNEALTATDLAALQAAQDSQPQPHQDTFTCMSPVYATSTFLPVTPVLVLGVNGWMVAYALLDQGSSSSFCTKDLVRRLGVATLGPANMTINTLTSAMSLAGDKVNLNLTSLKGSTIKMAKNLLAIEELPISSDYIVDPRQLEGWKHLMQLRFPAVKSARIDMLIGQNNAGLIKSRERIDGETDEEPYGIRTDLGWTIHGLNTRDATTEEAPTAAVHVTCDRADQTIAEKLDRLWSLDQVDEVDPMSADDRKVLKLWDEEHYIEDGHLHIPIPFKDKEPKLPNNYTLAEKRLRQVSRKLEKNPVLKSKYITGMQDYLDSGYAEKVPDMNQGTPGLVNYSCHQPVEREDKPDVCRIVYDFGALFLGICLNMMVHAGPNLTGNLVDIILRFRQYGVIVMADIKAMFNQVRVPPHHRDAMRFLWWKDHEIGGEIVCYRMLTHAFGGVWSPSACNYALRKLAQLYGDQYDRITCDALLRSFYVDDCIRSVINSCVGIRLLLQLRELLSRIGFTLTKFSSNDIAVTRGLPAADLAKGFESFHLDLTTSPKGKALGTGFEARGDMLIVRIIKVNKPLTKRGMLSLLSSIFDPIGILAPYIIRARMLFQPMCGPCSLSWDDVIPEAIMGTWEAWIDDIDTIAGFQIPRCFTLGHAPNDMRLHLHAFSDASEGAYAAAIYAVVRSGVKVTSLLLCAKARLAPLKTTSIPRLELCGAVQAVKLMGTVTRALDIKAESINYWTDSMIVLSSIKAESRSFKTFVGNRLSVIQQHSDVTQWHHVPTSENPADLPSRGCRAAELIDSIKWKSGPGFLLQPEELWPKIPSQTASFDPGEVKTSGQICLMTMVMSVSPVKDEETSDLFRQMLRDSPTWFRLQRNVAWLRRYIKYIAGKPVPHGFITPRELTAAKHKIILIVQRDITREQRGTTKFRKLFPFEEDGLCRVGGRLRNATPGVDYQVVHPLVIPPYHDVTRLIIRSQHESLGHAGGERTLAETRKEFWILSSRKAIRQTLAKCPVCQRLRSKPQEQLMADLPQSRLTPGKPPFYYTGVDFAGPFKIKIGRKQHTRYICVMTCFNTRAVHVEVAPGLDITSFLNAFQRFISRRGAPNTVYSDNGTNFVGGHNELREAMRKWNMKQVHDFMLQKQIHWQFNTPYASHHGGVWEGQIRTFRGVMLGLMREHVLTEDSLATLTCLVEQIMNSRPLTKISADVHDERPLTPDDLLTLNAGTVTGPPGIFNKHDLLTDRWRQSQYLADQFWSRWIKQYLPLLQSRDKWYEKAENLKPGDLVMLKEEMTASRLKWPLGIVTRVFPGKDDLVRSAEVRTKKGRLYRKPITKLFLLEGD